MTVVTDIDWTLVIVATVGAVPATIAAWNSRKTKKTTKVTNGKTLAQVVEATEKKLDKHIRSTNAHIREQASED